MDTTNNQQVAIKAEPIRTQTFQGANGPNVVQLPSMVQNEQLFLLSLNAPPNNKPGFPQVMEFGTECNINYLVQELLGSSLETIQLERGVFSANTVLLLAYEMVRSISPAAC